MTRNTLIAAISVLSLLLPAALFAQDAQSPVRVARADKILRLGEENPQGENLGEIENLLIDMTVGRIASATLAFGGWLGLGENLAPVPWDALTFKPGADRVTLNMDKEKLRKAPQFAKDKWPATVERQWLANAYAYYDKKPYWQAN